MGNVKTLLSAWRRIPEIGGNITRLDSIPARPGKFCPFPSSLDKNLIRVLLQKGIKNLYEHQNLAIQLIQQGKNIVISTGTASGKTLCYNLPVINTWINQELSRALYIFPTKALAQDQFNNLEELNQSIFEITEKKFLPQIYDGDTPAGLKTAIREKSTIILTNPDMLHIGILPHHTLWADFFSHLRYIVIDEIHIYRGVFGSHVANLIRRLKRIASFYGASPQFVLTSATIDNPSELACKLIEKPVEVILDDYSPKGERNFIFYNPPIIRPDIGLRRSAISECEHLASDLIDYRIQSILFCRTRRSVESIMMRLRQRYPHELVRGYRSGYLPAERRIIERDLRNGQTMVVAATNALELGIDIGDLDCVILVGYPGTISATIQQSGRAGRRSEASLTIYLATNNPLDQFMINHPEFILGRSPEKALIDPNNLLILLQHLKCAVFELPFRDDELYGNVDKDLLSGLLSLLCNEKIIHNTNSCNYWISDKYPANSISLRSSSVSQIKLQVVENGSYHIVGEVDELSSTWMVHPQAIYIHEGQTYLVNDLDFEAHRATLASFNGEYYTMPATEVEIEILAIQESSEEIWGKKYSGEVIVNSRVTGFQQIRWDTQERLGQYPLDMPITQLRTTAFWFEINAFTINLLREKGFWLNDRINYGPNWDEQRRKAKERDRHICQVCGAKEILVTHHVHHKTPFRQFHSYLEANVLDNLITLCPSCHKKVESAVRMRSGMAGLGYLLHNLAPVFMMCDIGDLGVYQNPQSADEGAAPSIFLYEHVPGGVGMAHALFQIQSELFQGAFDQVKSCSCQEGCPACVGPSGENGIGGKLETLELLRVLTGLE